MHNNVMFTNRKYYLDFHWCNIGILFCIINAYNKSLLLNRKEKAAVLIEYLSIPIPTKHMLKRDACS